MVTTKYPTFVLASSTENEARRIAAHLRVAASLGTLPQVAALATVEATAGYAKVMLDTDRIIGSRQMDAIRASANAYQLGYLMALQDVYEEVEAPRPRK